MGSVYTTLSTTMHLMILVSLAAAASAAPQIVPYVHEEVAAEPYIHQEVEAEPYVHYEPELSPLALGIVRLNAAPQQFAQPQFAPAAPAGYANGAWTGGCYNNLG